MRMHAVESDDPKRVSTLIVNAPFFDEVR